MCPAEGPAKRGSKSPNSVFKGFTIPHAALVQAIAADELTERPH